LRNRSTRSGFVEERECSAATLPVAVSAAAGLKDFLPLARVLRGALRASDRELLPLCLRSQDALQQFPLPRCRDAECGDLWNWRLRSILPSYRRYQEFPREARCFLRPSVRGAPAPNQLP